MYYQYCIIPLLRLKRLHLAQSIAKKLLSQLNEKAFELKTWPFYDLIRILMSRYNVLIINGTVKEDEEWASLT